MFVRVSLYVRHSRDTETAEGFWRAFKEAGGGDLNVSDLNVRQAEIRLREDFADHLQKYLNDAWAHSRWRMSKIIPRIVTAIYPKVTVQLIDIRYGSLELLLDVAGIDQEMIAEGFWDLLAFYSPIAVNDSFGTKVPFHSDVDHPTAGAPSKPNRVAVLQTSLLVPVLLALAVGWYSFDAMKERMRATDEERRVMREEHTKILAAAMTQNEKLSTAVLGRVSDAKSWEEFQQLAVKQILSLIPASNAASTTKTQVEAKQ